LIFNTTVVADQTLRIGLTVGNGFGTTWQCLLARPLITEGLGNVFLSWRLLRHFSSQMVWHRRLIQGAWLLRRALEKHWLASRYLN
jgi:hypothetical protein